MTCKELPVQAFEVSTTICRCFDTIRTSQTSCAAESASWWGWVEYLAYLVYELGTTGQVEYKFDLMLSTDGSGRGAALVAAVLKSQEEAWAPEDFKVCISQCHCHDLEWDTGDVAKRCINSLSSTRVLPVLGNALFIGGGIVHENGICKKS